MLGNAAHWGSLARLAPLAYPLPNPLPCREEVQWCYKPKTYTYVRYVVAFPRTVRFYASTT